KYVSLIDSQRLVPLRVIDLHLVPKFGLKLSILEEFCNIPIHLMYRYITSAPQRQFIKTLEKVDKVEQILENIKPFRGTDLIDINNGVLIAYITNIHKIFKNHIKKECLICQGKGYICEICDVSEIIFPFDGGVVVCEGCNTVLHHRCFTTRSSSCPRCARQEARRKQE
ncbi:unnamed protein product, partial [Meganyctiphanes norvegica]